MNGAIQLVPGKSDAMIAQELRASVEKGIAPLLAAMNEAKQLGFSINFNLGPDWRGQVAIQSLVISRQF